MESVQIIQEAIDENREAMPTEVVRVVMKESVVLNNFHSNLYRLTWTVVDSHAHIEPIEDEEGIAHVKLWDLTQTLIVEAVNERPLDSYGNCVPASKMPNQGMVLAGWLKLQMPFTYKEVDDESKLFIIHSIEPFVVKRPRESAD